jgi:hypothetical protein
MADLYPVAGSHIFIGGQMATEIDDLTESDFAGKSWVEIDGWSQMGAFGDAAALITTQLINRGRDVKQKGTANSGQMQNVFARIEDDAGQILLREAAAGGQKNNYAFKVEFPLQTGQTVAPNALFVGLAMGTQEAGGGANTIRNMNTTIEINSNIVFVDGS